jgi:hypothetical protein
VARPYHSRSESSIQPLEIPATILSLQPNSLPMKCTDCSAAFIRRESRYMSVLILRP